MSDRLDFYLAVALGLFLGQLIPAVLPPPWHFWAAFAAWLTLFLLMLRHHHQEDAALERGE